MSNCTKKPECQNERMGQFIKGMTATKKTQPDTHIPNQQKTKKVVI